MKMLERSKVVEIKSLYAAGATFEAIGERLNLTRETVRNAALDKGEYSTPNHVLSAINETLREINQSLIAIEAAINGSDVPIFPLDLRPYFVDDTPPPPVSQ